MSAQLVQSLYEVIDKATKPLQNIAKSAGMVGKAMGKTVATVAPAYGMMASGAWKAAEAASALLNPMALLVTGVGALGSAKGLIDMNSAFEGTQLSITGALRAFDAVGTKAADINKKFHAGTAEWATANHEAFEDARKVTASVMDQINKDAAALPGSAEDYVQVFKTALPAALSAGMSDIGAIAKFTNDFAATASANQIDSVQAANDLSMILRGQAGMQVKTWTVLQPLIGKSAQEWNKLSAPKRAAEMQTALLKYKPLLNEFGSTWDAIYGTTEANVKLMLRTSSVPLFEFAKKNLQAVNDWLDKNSSIITGALTKGFTKIVSLAEKLGGVLGKIDFEHIANTIKGSGGMAAKGMGVMSAVRMTSMLGPIGAIAGMGAMALMKKNGPTAEGASGAFEKITGMLGQVVDRVWPFVDALAQAAGTILEALMPAVMGVGKAFGDFMAAIQPSIPALGGALADVVKNLTPSFVGLAQSLVELTPVVVDLTKFLADVLKKSSGWIEEAGKKIVEFTSGEKIISDKDYEDYNKAAESFKEQFGLGTKQTFDPTNTGPGLGDKISSTWESAFSQTNLQDKVQGLVDTVGDIQVAGGAYLGVQADAAWQTEADLYTTTNALLPFGQGLLQAQSDLGLFSAGVQDSVTGVQIAMGALGGIAGAIPAIAMLHKDALLPDKRGLTPAAKGGAKVHNDFRYGSFNIKQMFAEGFDPDRIGIAFVDSLRAQADQKLGSGLAPVFSTTR